MEDARKLLGLNVRAHRKELRITQDQLAERVDKSLGTIQLLESGKVWPEHETLQKLAKVFGTHETALFSAAFPRPKPTPQQAVEVLLEFVNRAKLPEELSEDKQALFDLIRDLGDDKAKDLRDLLSRTLNREALPARKRSGDAG